MQQHLGCGFVLAAILNAVSSTVHQLVLRAEEMQDPVIISFG